MPPIDSPIETALLVIDNPMPGRVNGLSAFQTVQIYLQHHPLPVSTGPVREPGCRVVGLNPKQDKIALLLDDAALALSGMPLHSWPEFQQSDLLPVTISSYPPFTEFVIAGDASIHGPRGDKVAAWVQALMEPKP
jgi:hypothetical protein